MPRNKRKRVEVEPVPTPSRRRRGAVGNEPTENKKPNNDESKNDNEQQPMLVEAKETSRQQQQQNQQKEIKGQGAAAKKATTNEGNDHAVVAATPAHEAAVPQNSAAAAAGSTVSAVATAAAAPLMGSGAAAAAAAETTIEKKKLTRSTLPSASAPATPREARIRALLEHRKLLLKQVGQGRRAAAQRIQAYNSKATATTPPQTDAQEMAAFVEMTKLVTSLARKQSRASDTADNTGERRTSVSLRRGSSVGARMNAALSSLAPGLQQQQQQHGGPSGGLATGVNTDPTVSGMAPLPPARSQSMKAPKRPNSAAGRGAGPGGAGRKVPAGRGLTAQKSAPLLSQQQQRPTATSAAGGGGGVAIKGMTGRRMLTKPPREQNPPHPRTVCLEAVRLRERRDAIRTKLTGVMQMRLQAKSSLHEQQQQQQQPLMALAERRRSSFSLSPSPQAIAARGGTPQRQVPPPQRTGSQQRPLWKGPDVAPALPRRRKTHWDVVLEEMRWLATDFREERKWKHSAARLMGDGAAAGGALLEERNRAAGAPLTGDESTTATGNQVSPSRKVEAAKIDAMDLEKKGLSDTENVEATKQAATNDVVDVDHFEEITSDDEACSLEVAKRVSGLLSDFVKSSNATLFSTPPGETAVNASATSPTINDVTPSSLAGNDEPMTEQNGETVGGGHFDKSAALALASKHVDGMLKAMADKCKSQKGSAKTHGMALDDEQAKVVCTIEHRWRLGAGAALAAPLACGKTIAICSLVWRKRLDGPQMVICSSASMIRWLHELGRFPDLNIKVLNSVAEIFGVSDVVVCNYSVISKMEEALLATFLSIVIDCRYPTGFSGSRPTVSEATGHSSKDAAAPEELSASEWWSKVALATSRAEVNRLVIDKTEDVPPFLRGLTNRRLLEVLALRVGFLFGSKEFISQVYTVEKAILAWCRRRIKGGTGSGSKFQRVKNLLLSLAKHFYCDMERQSALEKFSGADDSQWEWEVRQCAMPRSQRVAYNNACEQARSSLARSFGVNGHPDSDPFAACIAALLRIRRHCTHADIGGSLGLAGEANLSQPNSELARHILAGSGKLRQLISILVHESECAFVADELTQALLPGEKSTARSKKRESKVPKKVVIVAALLEIQILASTLLKSVGIDHEMLVGQVDSPGKSFAVPVSSAVSEASAVAWSRSQLALSKFNSVESTVRSQVNVVITSLVSVAGDHGGLGVEQADTVIVLDEDWSGRGELLMRALLARCHFRREVVGEGACRVIRLVTKDCCEDILLSTAEVDSTAELESAASTWPLTALGEYIAPVPLASDNKETARKRDIWQARSTAKNLFAFPGRNLFLRRNDFLEDVLSVATSLPQLLTSSTKLRFLPTFDEENAVDIETLILNRLMKEEELGQSSCVLQSDCPLSWSPSLPPLLSDFPDSLMQRMDMYFASSRLYLHRLSRVAALEDYDVTNESVLRLPNSQGSTTGTFSPSESTDLVDTGLNSAVAKSSTEMAASILFYDLSETRNPSGAVKTMMPGTLVADSKRVNLYSSLFSSVSNVLDVYDGNQGSEALVYFPPIFPRMQECASLAKGDVESMESRLPFGTDQPGETGVGEKRKDVSPATSSGMKRSRVITEDEASHSDAASVLFDLSDDYGLAGMGAVPLPRDSALAAASFSNESSFDVGSEQNYWLANTALCDAEEYQGAFQVDSAGEGKSMILFVSRKRPRGYAAPPSSQLGRVSGWNGLSSGGSSFYPEYNGANKKGQTSAFNRIPSLDMAQQGRPTGQQYQKGKDIYRQRLLSSLRQSGVGSTMFEAPVFRVASVRVRNKVSDRLLSQGWTAGAAFDAGPGLPLLVSKQHSNNSGYRGMFEVDPNLWTSIVKRLKNKDAATGGEAIDLSLAQRAALRRSLVAPCRVDFGPFQSGFLSPPSGMTAAAPPRPRTGVSLPMGVKITPVEKDQEIAKERELLMWNESDDDKLQNAAVRFGMNWILAARVLSGFQDIVICSQPESDNFLHHRAARSCRDRWQRLARSNPVMVMKARQSERFTARADAVPEGGDSGQRLALSRSKEDSKPGVEFLLSSTDESVATSFTILSEKRDDKCELKEQPQRKGRRTFSAFMSARAKKLDIPISIPGVTGSAPAVGPSHLSHDQAVQTSVSVGWSAGRTDMWPLQLLDAADKQRAAVTAAAASAAALPSPGDRQAQAYPSRPHSTTNGASRTPSSSGHSNRRTTSSSGVPPPQRSPGIVPNYNAVHPIRSAVPRPAASPPNRSASASAAAKESFAPPQAAPSVAKAPNSTLAAPRPPLVAAAPRPPPISAAPRPSPAAVSTPRAPPVAVPTPKATVTAPKVVVGAVSAPKAVPVTVVAPRAVAPAAVAPKTVAPVVVAAKAAASAAVAPKTVAPVVVVPKAAASAAVVPKAAAPAPNAAPKAPLSVPTVPAVPPKLQPPVVSQTKSPELGRPEQPPTKT